jgi:hypothetical protein
MKKSRRHGGTQAKGLSQDPGLFQGDVGELQMDEGQVVADFLFPTDKQTPRSVCPRVANFDQLTASALPGATLRLDFALTRNVWNISVAILPEAAGRVSAFGRHRDRIGNMFIADAGNNVDREVAISTPPLHFAARLLLTFWGLSRSRYFGVPKCV